MCIPQVKLLSSKNTQLRCTNNNYELLWYSQGQWVAGMAFHTQLTAPDPPEMAFWEDYLARRLHWWHIGAQWGWDKAEEWKGLCGAAGAECGTRRLLAAPCHTGSLAVALPLRAEADF